MLYINLIIILGFIIGFLGSGRNEKDETGETNRIIRAFIPLSSFLLERVKIIGNIVVRKKTEEHLRSVYVNEDQKKIKRDYACKKISMALFLLFTANWISFGAGLILEGQKNQEKFYSIERQEPGEGSKEISIKAEVEEEKVNTEINMEINERRYTDKQWEEQLNRAYQYIDKTLPGGNQSLDNVKKDLFFAKELPGSGITIYWETDDENLIGDNGEIIGTNIPDKGLTTSVTALICYLDYQVEYKKNITLYPSEMSDSEKLKTEVEGAIQQSEKNYPTQRVIKLPSEVEGKRIKYQEKTDHKPEKIMLGGVISALFIFIAADKELANRNRKRNIELLMDYPELINKYTLLLKAGMTIKGAWIKICSDYREKRKGKRRYVYEEMSAAAYQMSNGLPERKAFENFGKRIKLLPYLRFTSLLVQNIRKGSKGLSELLELEGVEAFEERKELAKKLGEEAGTKLLMPMAVILILVIAIIVVPAFAVF